jgi:hypothetical protein
LRSAPWYAGFRDSEAATTLINDLAPRVASLVQLSSAGDRPIVQVLENREYARETAMPLVKNVERKIWDVEQFDVIVKHGDGRDMRGDKAGIPQYPYERAKQNASTVADWKASRFSPIYPGFDVDVIDGTGEPVAGNTLLSTVRDSYLED